MAFKEATDCCAGTAAIYGAPDIVKIAEFLNGKVITGCCPVLPRDTIFTISDATAPTALIRFDATSITAGQTRVVTVPDANLILVGTTTCQTLSSKTLTTPTISGTGFTNAQHAHLAANSGGTITAAAVSDFAAVVTCNAAVVANTAKVTNATHAGEVTGATCLTVADNVIGLPELTHGTAGNLFTFDACCVPAFVATGTCGQVLISGGAGTAPAFGAAGAADNLGDHTATSCLLMGTNAIQFGVDAVVPAACLSYHTVVAAGHVYNAISCDIHDFQINATSIMTVAPTIVNLACAVFQECCIAISPVGTHTQWIPAGAWGTVTTNGAEFAELELATNDIMLQTFNFDTTTSEKIQFWWEPPAEWNAGTITFNTKWTAAGGCACQTFILSLAGHSYTNSDAIDAALGGTPATTTDLLITVNDMHNSPESTAVTIEGATKGEAVVLQLSRTISDTLSVDAKVIGINITYTTDEATAT